jgi:RHS repeat-associated protein
VSADGGQIVPDPGVAIREFTGAMVGPPGLAPLMEPCDGNPPDGDPVDLGTGLFVLQKTDLVSSDVLSIGLHRTYRQNDSVSRSFGIGATHVYDMFLVGTTFPYTYIDLILPDGRVHYDRISPGTGYADAVYEHTTSPRSAWFKSRISWNGDGWNLDLKDGTRIVFREGFTATRPAQSAAIRIQDRYGNAVVLTRNIEADLTRITSPNGRWIELTYDSSHRVTQAKDNLNRIVSYTYDGSGRLWKVTDAASGVTEYTYDTQHRMLTLKDARGIVYLTNEYDTAGRVIKQTQADTTTYQFSYTVDGSGRITQTDVTNPRGFIRRVAFDPLGYVSSDTRALGQSVQQRTSYEREPGTNLVLAVVDPLNRRTVFAYDPFANLASVTRLAGTNDAVTTSYTYEPVFQQLATVTDPLFHTTSFSHDAKGSVTSVTDPLNHETTFTHNAAGQPLTVTTPAGMTQIGYEGGDVTSVTDGLGRTTSRFNDGGGRVVSVTDPLGRMTRYEYDALNQLTKTIDALQNATSYTYDPNGNLLTLTDARNNTTTWTYDNMDRVATRTDPLTRQESFTYDANGNPSTWTDRKGRLTTYTYDALDRQTFVGYGTIGNPPTHESTIATIYDAGNRATQVVDSAAGTIIRTHDLLDGLSKEVTPEGEIDYTYDAAGRRTTMTVAGQSAVAYTYDNADRLTAMTQGSAIVSMAYDNANRRTSLTLPNGIVVEYGYGDDSQLTALTYKQGSTTIGTLFYTYDANGQPSVVSGSYARSNMAIALTAASYDDANQVVTFGGISLTYDTNGNLTNDGARSYTWNARDQLTGIAGPVSASFAYDGIGRRRAKTVSGTTTQFLYDGLNPVQELAGATPTANLLTGLGIDEFFTRTDSAGARHYLADALGNSLALSDGAGTLQTQYTYEPFGGTTTSGAPSTNAYQFTGREVDGTGLFFYRARFYDPALHRFIGEDPIGLTGGDVNLHAYVANAPTLFVDPLGLQTSSSGRSGGGGQGDPFVQIAKDVAGRAGYVNDPRFYLEFYLWSLVGGVDVAGFRLGYEITITRNLRIAPWGNRTGHPWGRWTHWHRRIIDPKTGIVRPGGGMKNHRPWEPRWKMPKPPKGPQAPSWLPPWLPHSPSGDQPLGGRKDNSG